MKSIYIAKYGGPEALELREEPDPEPGPDQVRLRVKACGVNFADIMMRMGLYPRAPEPPFVPGFEAAGVIDAVGPGVTKWKKHDRVVAPTDHGGYADTLIASEDEVFRLPADKTFEAGAALVVNYLTAYEALVEQGHLQKGRRVLIHHGAGGVGLAAVQVARLFDAEIIATASPIKFQLLKSRGVAHCIDARKLGFDAAVSKLTGGRGVHIVLDAVGGFHFRRSYRCLAPSGKLIVYGFSAAAKGLRKNLLLAGWHKMRTPSFDPMQLMADNRGVIGIHLGRLTSERELLADAMHQLMKWWSEGKIEPFVGATFPLEQAGKAHEFIQKRQNVGKVVLKAGQ